MHSIDRAAGDWLLRAARNAISRRLGQAVPALPPVPQALAHPAACFVTLTQGGQLRGCIGTLVAQLPLEEAVTDYACKAAFEDPRFAALALNELPGVRIEVSVLSPAAPFKVASDEALCQQLRPGIDGLILRDGVRCATFLPQVWQSLPEPRRFVAELKRKAGIRLAKDASQLECERYQVQAFHEAE